MSGRNKAVSEPIIVRQLGGCEILEAGQGIERGIERGRYRSEHSFSSPLFAEARTEFPSAGLW